MQTAEDAGFRTVYITFFLLEVLLVYSLRLDSKSYVPFGAFSTMVKINKWIEPRTYNPTCCGLAHCESGNKI